MWDEFTPILDQYLIPMTYQLPEPALDQMVEFGETPAGARLAEISELTFVEMLDEYGFTDPRVRMALLSLPAMWGLHLEDPLGYLYPLYLCRMLSAALVKGGSHRLSSALYRSLPAQRRHRCSTSARWRASCSRDGAAVGVETTDGRRFDARAVVSTLDPEQTFLRLLDESSLPGDLGDRPCAAGSGRSGTMFGLHLGLRGGISWKANDPADRRLDDRLLRARDRGRAARAPPPARRRAGARLRVAARDGPDALRRDHGARRPRSAAGRGRRPVRRAMGARREQPSRDSCLRLLGGYADLGEIVFRRHTTPLDIEAKLTTMKRGSIKHGAYTPLQMGYLRPNDLCSRSETPIPGLFVGGASMYPGGMILGGPGYLAAGVVGTFLGNAGHAR